MIPFRKMRSRSLAVVELVLSLKVSRRLCITESELADATGIFVFFECLSVYRICQRPTVMSDKVK